MELNWTIEVITTFGIFFPTLLFVYLSYKFPKIKNLKSIFYFRLVYLLYGIAFFLEGLSDLLLIKSLSLISAFLFFPGVLCLIIAINNIMKDHFFSYSLLFLISLAPLFFYLGFQSESIILVEGERFTYYTWGGLFNVIGEIYTGLGSLYLFYWGYKTWRNAPFLIKKETNIFFLGIILTSALNLSIYFLSYINRIFLAISNIVTIFGFIFILVPITFEPKILYILPFTLQRILVKDKNGYPLFDHDWAESNINETVFTGFINAAQKMSEDIIHMGGILDINLKEGILILQEMKYITIGIISSKSSKLLRKCLVNFGKDFEEKFERELKKGIIDMDEYEGAYELLDKYFSNFPYKFITSKKQQLMLTGKYAKINPQLDNKLKEIFPNDKDYKKIKTEMQKTPIPVIKEFLDLHKTLKEEPDYLEEEDMEHLDLKLDESPES